MESSEAKGRFIALLVDAGIDLVHPVAEDLRTAIEVMRKFSTDHFSDIDQSEYGDGFLAQFGTYGWGHGETFEADLTRQLMFTAEDGEFLRFEHLKCTFHFQPDDDLRRLGAAHVWSSQVGINNFWAAATALDGFQIRRPPLRLEILHEEV